MLVVANEFCQTRISVSFATSDLLLGIVMVDTIIYTIDLLLSFKLK